MGTFVDVAVLVWVPLFAVVVAAGRGVGLLSGPTTSALRLALAVPLAGFLVDVVLRYRWSENPPKPFVREHWFWIITGVPWFRPLRLLRVGRAMRAVGAPPVARPFASRRVAAH